MHTLRTMKKTKFSKPESDYVLHCILYTVLNLLLIYLSLFSNLIIYSFLLPRLYLSKYTNFSSYFLRLLSVRYGEMESWIQNVSKFKIYADLSFEERLPKLLSRWLWFTFKYYVSCLCLCLALFSTITNILKLKTLISKMHKTVHCCFGHFLELNIWCSCLSEPLWILFTCMFLVLWRNSLYFIGMNPMLFSWFRALWIFFHKLVSSIYALFLIWMAF